MIEAYLNHLKESGASPRTLDSYERSLKRFFAHARKGFLGVKKEDVEAFIASLKQEVSLSSIGTYVTPCTSFYTWLVQEGHVSSNPTDGVAIPARPEKHLSDKICTIPERAMVIGSIKGQTFEARRDRAILETGCAFGARVSDLVNLDLPDLDFDRAEVHLRHGKGGKNAVLPLTDAAMKRLKEYLYTRDKAVSNGELAVFVNVWGGRLTRKSIWRIVKKYTDPILPVEKATPHAFFRHSTARQLIDGGAPLTDVQAFLRHSRVTTTQIYTKATANTLREMVSRCHPRAVLS